MPNLLGREISKCLGGLMVLLLAVNSGITGPKQSATQKRDDSVVPENRTIYITVRVRPDVKRETLDHLRRITTPERVRVKSSWDPKEILRRFYGYTTQTMHDLLTSVNPTLYKQVAEPDESREVILPPGVKGAVDVEIVPQSKMTAREWALIEMGSDGEITRRRFEEANPTLKGHWNDPVKEKIKIPYKVDYASYAFREGSLDECRGSANSLKGKDSAVLSASCSFGFWAAPHWHLAGTSAAACPAKDGLLRWPFESLPKDWFLQNQDKIVTKTVMGIVDSGIPQYDARFTLWENSNPGMPITIDPNSTQCIRDFHGCNFVNPAEFPEDDCQIPDEYNHGTHIAGLASARLYENPGEIDRRVELMILKVTDRNGQIEPGRINNAIRYADQRPAWIINLSLTGSPDDSLTETIRASKRMLFVAAAGNPSSGAGVDLDDDRITNSPGSPARLAKEEPNVISVAAHDGEGGLVCFSNYGGESVSLAAPGYQVESTVSKGGTRILSGTSQATALVSLTAALLYSRGLQDPFAIKRRIIAATDYESGLRGKVFSEGKLNIAKALDYEHDLIQYRDGRTISGEIKAPLSISVAGITNDLSLRGEVSKIILNYSKEPGKRIRVIALLHGKLIHFYSDNIGQVQFESSQGTLPISPDELAEIIPSQRFHEAPAGRSSAR